MAFNSMTGFGRSDSARGATLWHWEVRSVNGRGLDVRLRLPAGLDHLEARCREVVARDIARGNVTATLTIKREGEAVAIRLNETVLAQVMKAADRVLELTGGRHIAPESLLQVRGVLEVVEAIDDETEVQARADQIISTLQSAVDALIESRRQEGGRLHTVVSSQIDAVEARIHDIERSPARKPEAVVRRLAEQVARLGNGTAGLDPQRLHQEAVLLATRADIEEELRRLASHVAAARTLLASSGPTGRKLDFLSQEFFREANTLTSKSIDAEITRLGLEMKVVIDQMREQVQNIE